MSDSKKRDDGMLEISLEEPESFAVWLRWLKEHYEKDLGLDPDAANKRAAKRLVRCYVLPPEQQRDCVRGVFESEGFRLDQDSSASSVTPKTK